MPFGTDHLYIGYRRNYDLGSVWENWKQLFGDNLLWWFIPVETGKGNGYNYPSVQEVLENDSDTMSDSDV